MTSSKIIYKRLLEPFNIIAILSFILAILSLFRFGAWGTVLGSFLVTAIAFLVILGIGRIVDVINFRSKVKFYRNWDEVPLEFDIGKTLRHITRQKATLEIIGRTCFRCLCGNEIEFEQNMKSYSKNKSELQRQICEAIINECRITFVLQNPNIPIPYFKTDENIKLREHALEAIKSYDEIRQQLPRIDLRNRFLLKFSNEVIESSMLRITEGSTVTRLIVDLSDDFAEPNNSIRRISKPILAFSNAGAESIEDYNRNFNYFLSNSSHKEEMDKKTKIGHKEVEALISQYTFHSDLRKDESKYLATIAARRFLSARGNSDSGVPPICVQLLITNQCTTFCKMCDHYKLFRKKEELSKDELLCTLDCIKNLGTTSVIFSGGEPLANDNLFELLDYGKRLGLNIGMITSGVMKGGQHIGATEAKVISQTCSWIQLSIDSFNKETYKKIRHGDHLSVALNSLAHIVRSGFRNLEVCFTIQKDNINEIETIPEIINEVIPPTVPLRFKFAHGPEAGRDFLCSESLLKDAIRKLRGNSDRLNSKYLINMIEQGYFNYEDLSNGMPLREKMVQYKQLGYTCQVLNYFCFIDSNGDVYPCCYLFDDNHAESKMRSETRIGSIRSSSTGRVTSPNDSLDNFNKLSYLWYESKKLKELRQETLPVRQEACFYCTRHFYQNEYLNKLEALFEKYRYQGIVEEWRSNGGEIDLIHPIWM